MIINPKVLELTKDQLSTYTIEQKLDLLPYVDFEDLDDLYKVLSSELFDDIFEYYKKFYFNDKLDSKTPIEQKISTYLYLTDQEQKQIDNIEDTLYWRPCPTIEEFINSDEYLGLLFKNSLYSYWKRTYSEIFAPGSAINKVIFTGSTSAGKSTAARIGVLYSIYRLICLRDPRAVLNVSKESVLSAFILSVNLKLAERTNYDPFLSILENSPCFRRVRKVEELNNFGPNDPVPFVPARSDVSIKFPNNIMFQIGSTITHTVSNNIFCSFSDEVSEKSSPVEIEKTLNLLNSIDKRLEGRFMGSNYIFQIIASSAKTSNSALGEYIKKIPKTPSFKIYNPRAWEIKDDVAFIGDGTTFPVLVGNGVIQSRILTQEEDIKQAENGTFPLENGCFTEDTQILTSKGYKSFKELVNNYKDIQVYSVDPNTFQITSSNIKIVTKTKEVQHLIEFNFNNTIIKCTLDHKFLLKDGTYKMAKDLTENDDIVDTSLYYNYKYKMYTKEDIKYIFNDISDILQQSYLYISNNPRIYTKQFKQLAQQVLDKYPEVFNSYKEFRYWVKLYHNNQLSNDLLFCPICNERLFYTKAPRHYVNTNRTCVSKCFHNNMTNEQKQLIYQKINTTRRNNRNGLYYTPQELQKCSMIGKNLESHKKQVETCRKLYGYGRTWCNRDKAMQTMKLNHSFARSKLEDEIYQLLLTKYKNIKRQYKSTLYPFHCDFYIEDIDTYMEIQGFYTHGPFYINRLNCHEPYDPNNIKHQQALLYLQQKINSSNTSDHQKQINKDIIKVWTSVDPLKRQIAKNNNLKYIEIFTKQEFMQWFNK